MRHHRKRGRRARRRGFHGRAQAGGVAPPADGTLATVAVAVPSRAAAPVNGGPAHAPEPPNLDAMVSALLEAEAHAAEAQARALAEAQAHVEALELPVKAEMPLVAEDVVREDEAEDPAGRAAHLRRRSGIPRTHVTPARTRQRLVYLAAGIVVAVLVITVLSWMEWWDLAPVSLLPAPE